MVNRYQNKSTLTAYGVGIINFTGHISIDGVILKISVSQIDPKTLEVRPSGISFYDKAKGYVFKDLYPNVSCVLNSVLTERVTVPQSYCGFVRQQATIR